MDSPVEKPLTTQDVPVSVSDPHALSFLPTAKATELFLNDKMKISEYIEKQNQTYNFTIYSILKTFKNFRSLKLASE